MKSQKIFNTFVFRFACSFIISSACVCVFVCVERLGVKIVEEVGGFNEAVVPFCVANKATNYSYGFYRVNTMHVF